jgi:hypothetical protein
MGNNNNTFEVKNPSELKDFLEFFCYKDANGTENKGACAYSKFLADQNKFSWTQSLALPAAQALAQILLLKYQKSQYDELDEKRIGYLEDAIDKWGDCVDDLLDDVKLATDDAAEPAMYQPVSPSGEQYQTISDNTEILPSAGNYIKMVNDYHREEDLLRAAILNPRYYQMNEIVWISIEKLINGDLPVGITMEVMTKSAETACKTGRLGRSSRQTARNLGIIDYRIQKVGRAEQRDERMSQNRDVNPLPRSGDIREMMIKPQDRIGYAIEQGQLLQNALQNAYNACARKAPYLQAQIEIKLQKCQQTMAMMSAKASALSGYVPNFAAVLNNQVRDVINGAFKGIDQSFGFGNSATLNNPAPMRAIPVASRGSTDGAKNSNVSVIY